MKIKLKLKEKSGKVEKWLESLQNKEYLSEMDKCGQKGVSALSSATPVDSGKTAASWSYEVEQGGSKTTIVWKNDNVTRDGDPIAILLQYGHGTGTGGYVVGRDYINPAMSGVFDESSDAVWKVAMKS